MAASVPFYRRDMKSSFDWAIISWTIPTKSAPHVGVLCHEIYDDDVVDFFFVTVVRDDTSMEIRLIDGSGFGIETASDETWPNWQQTIKVLDNYKVFESVAALYPDYRVLVVEEEEGDMEGRDEVAAIVDEMYAAGEDINNLIRLFDDKVRSII
jgi:hypothetical protein